jgi:hypothetical protein
MHSNDHQLGLSGRHQTGYCVIPQEQFGVMCKVCCILLAPEGQAYHPQSQCVTASMVGGMHSALL